VPRLLLTLSLGALLALTACANSEAQTIVCDRSYPDTCIFPPLPDLDCIDIPHRQFRVRSPDSHRFDRTRDGLGCTPADMRGEQTEDE
jgi:hypothetical protein